MAIAGKLGAVYVSDIVVAPVAFTTQATTKNAANTRYQVTNAAFWYWPLDAAITVLKNAVPVTTGFTLERAGGFVVFSPALLGTDVVTVTGSALTLVQAGGFFNWSVDAEGETAETTTYASAGWKEFSQVIKGWSGNAEAYWGNDRFFKSLGQIIVVKLFVDTGASQRCLEGFALITSDNIESAVDEIVQESVDFTGVGPLYPRLD